MKVNLRLDVSAKRWGQDPPLERHVDTLVCEVELPAIPRAAEGVLVGSRILRTKDVLHRIAGDPEVLLGVCVPDSMVADCIQQLIEQGWKKGG